MRFVQMIATASFSGIDLGLFVQKIFAGVHSSTVHFFQKFLQVFFMPDEFFDRIGR